MKKCRSLVLCSMGILLSTPSWSADEPPVDVVLIGGGIMSATLGTYLKELEPDWNIHLYERLDQVADESSNAWNNAGTGHSAFAELNYTPEQADGSVDISRAVAVTEQFEISRQFWAHQLTQGVLNNPRSFINTTPHMSFVWGDDNVEFLRKRHEAMVQNPLYAGMEYSEDYDQIAEWAPLLIEGRAPGDRIAATRMPIGTDVNFGEITRQTLTALTQRKGFSLSTGSEVRDLTRNDDGTWKVTIADLNDGGRETSVDARFVFIGAGGAALKLLQRSGIPESKDYAGFPVGGQFLYTTNPEVVARHDAKAYGKASVGSPPMSVPHLDRRVLDGEPALMFGPFATFSSKFLKQGSWTDLFSSMTFSNTWPMVQAGWHNLSLSRYLIGQLMMSQDDRIASLRDYYPEVNPDDWKLWTAGQRVQIIRNDEEKGGVLEFGTDTVIASDGSLAALMGASPGASTSPSIMLRLIERAFPEEVASAEWQQKLHEIIPSYGQKLSENPELLRQVRLQTHELLELSEPMPSEEVESTPAPEDDLPPVEQSDDQEAQQPEPEAQEV
ncbi:malate dehydrogenase (quinone) [Halotalea alkalilenta]|uniref:malate dehydrogenase (quinone) n=1 Tax=Halotalea alkalilenta TaxID=376489 RepID=UPI000486CF62